METRDAEQISLLNLLILTCSSKCVCFSLCFCEGTFLHAIPCDITLNILVEEMKAEKGIFGWPTLLPMRKPHGISADDLQVGVK